MKRKDIIIKNNFNKVKENSLFVTGGTITDEKVFNNLPNLKALKEYQENTNTFIKYELKYYIKDNILTLILDNKIKRLKLVEDREFAYKLQKTQIRCSIETFQKDMFENSLFNDTFPNVLYRKYFK